MISAGTYSALDNHAIELHCYVAFVLVDKEHDCNREAVTATGCSTRQPRGRLRTQSVHTLYRRNESQSSKTRSRYGCWGRWNPASDDRPSALSTQSARDAQANRS